MLLCSNLLMEFFSGYMAPEYAADGLYSVKSDVFSYGILVLEIISGKKNRGFYLEDSQHNLIGHVSTLDTIPRNLLNVKLKLDY